MDELVKIIQTVGFPIFVACYFMFRNDKKTDKLIEMVSKMCDKLTIIKDDLDGKKDGE